MMLCSVLFFFFNDTATTEIYTLSLHDALPILDQTLAFLTNGVVDLDRSYGGIGIGWTHRTALAGIDRKSTRLNSSHANISYAVFCLKKKKQELLHDSHTILDFLTIVSLKSRYT